MLSRFSRLWKIREIKDPRITILAKSNNPYKKKIKNTHKNIKTEFTRILSNFDFQWTKILYQNNLKHIAFFLTFFKG